MARVVQLTPKEELKQIFTETLLNHTSEVTKVSNNSVLSGIGYGVASTGQKAIVEVAAVESHLFPDTAVGNQLDTIASNYGISPRFSASGSSTYLRIDADNGTQYIAGTQTFIGNEGVVFSLDEDITIGSLGFGYAKVSSISTGQDSNVPPLSINTVNPIPSGHNNVINEYAASGGRDNESDDLFRKRIKEGVNILARGTISSLEQAFIKVNNNVLRIFNQGLDDVGNIKIAIATQNGSDLSSNELQSLLESTQDFFSLTEFKPFSQNSYGIVLSNIEYDPIDINYRVQLESGYNPDTYRIDVQAKMNKYLNFTSFDPEVDLVEWDDLLEIAKNTRGARSVQDQYFFVNNGRVDYRVDRSKLPRIRSFAIYDADGVLIQNLSGTLSPVFFPNQTDLNFQLTALSSIN